MTEPAIALPDAKLIAKLDGLPTIPLVALELGVLVHSKSVSVQQIANLLRTDPSTSAKLLRMVNSPYFGIPGGVSDVARAIPFIGFNTLYQLVLSITVVEALDDSGDAAIRALWLHSLAVATVARELAIETKVADPGACFTAGLLHDMGTIALAKLEPARFAAACAVRDSEGLSSHEAEQRVGLPSHSLLGGALARQWRFPAMLAVPIEQHHGIHRPQIRGKLTPNLRTLTELVAAADVLAAACESSFDTAIERPENLEAKALFEQVGVSAEQRRSVCDRARYSLAKSQVFLSILK